MKFACRGRNPVMQTEELCGVLTSSGRGKLGAVGVIGDGIRVFGKIPTSVGEHYTFELLPDDGSGWRRVASHFPIAPSLGVCISGGAGGGSGVRYFANLACLLDDTLRQETKIALAKRRSAERQRLFREACSRVDDILSGSCAAVAPDWASALKQATRYIFVSVFCVRERVFASIALRHILMFLQECFKRPSVMVFGGRIAVDSKAYAKAGDSGFSGCQRVVHVSMSYQAARLANEAGPGRFISTTSPGQDHGPASGGSRDIIVSDDVVAISSSPQRTSIHDPVVRLSRSDSIQAFIFDKVRSRMKSSAALTAPCVEFIDLSSHPDFQSGITLDEFMGALSDADAAGRFHVVSGRMFLGFDRSDARYVFSRIVSGLGQPGIGCEGAVSRFSANAKGAFDVDPTPGQISVMRGLLGSRVAFLGGGVGVGKSTVIRALVRIFAASDLDHVVYAAPTHCVVNNLRRALSGTVPEKRPPGLCSKTSDAARRFVTFTTVAALIGSDAPPPSVLIVDEASMIGMDDFLSLVRLSSESECVIFCGDPEQIDPVSPGAPFRTFHGMGVSRNLDCNIRCASLRVARNLDHIRAGHAGKIEYGDDFVDARIPGAIIRDCSVESMRALSAHAVARAKEVLGENLREARRLLSTVRCISPYSALSVYCARDIKRWVYEEDCSDADMMRAETEILYVGEPVMFKTTRAAMGAFTYDTAVVDEILSGATNRIPVGDSRHPYPLFVKFSNGVSTSFRSPGDMRKLVGSALGQTAHSAQGSTVEHVIFVTRSSKTGINCRNVAYSACGRARKTVCVVGDNESVLSAFSRPPTRHPAPLDFFASGAIKK